jgi:hypothetical protein
MVVVVVVIPARSPLAHSRYFFCRHLSVFFCRLSSVFLLSTLVGLPPASLWSVLLLSALVGLLPLAFVSTPLLVLISNFKSKMYF